MFNKKLIDLNLNRSKLINLKNSLSYLIENPILVIEPDKSLFNNDLSKYKSQYLYLMLSPSNWSKDKDHNIDKDTNLQFNPLKEYNCKVIYSIYGENVNNTTALILLHNYFEGGSYLPKTTIVKVSFGHYRTTVIEYEGNSLISTTYASFLETLREYPHILEKYQSTLFIFHKSTWEMVRILFKLSGIRVSGGSHTKRHLISPLEVRLIDFMERLKSFELDIMEWKKISFSEIEYWTRELLEYERGNIAMSAPRLQLLKFKLSLRNYNTEDSSELTEDSSDKIERVLKEYKNILYAISINSYQNYDNKVTKNFRDLYNIYHQVFSIFKLHNPTKLLTDLRFFHFYLYNFISDKFAFKLKEEYLSQFSEFIIEIDKLLENKPAISKKSSGVNRISKRSFTSWQAGKILRKRNYSSIVPSNTNNHYPELLENNLLNSNKTRYLNKVIYMK